MARTLTVTRVRVAVEQQADYLAVLAEIDALGRGLGRHLWVFRGADPEVFLEFSESGAMEDHRAVRAAAGREAELEARLQALGSRDASGDELWHEVPLPAHAT